MDRIRVYECSSSVLVVGSLRGAPGERCVRLLEFDKAQCSLGTQEGLAAGVREERGVFTTEEMDEMLLTKTKGERLTKVLEAVAILGCVKFVKGYYLVLVTNQVCVGEIHHHKVLASKGRELVPLFETEQKQGWSLFKGSQDPAAVKEEELKGLFKLVDLSKSYYWSYTYNLSISLQTNTAIAALKAGHAVDGDIPAPQCTDRCVWNKHLASSLLEALGKDSIDSCDWLITLIHGSFRQQRISIFARSLSLTLIGRRSRHFAGTRYLKRGVNEFGHVANDVEVEQILQDHMFLPDNECAISSYVQMRGSIPTFWSQATSVAMPRPPIKRQRFDPWYRATRLHFEDLFARYGDQITVLNLVKQSEKHKRETIVGSDFKHAVELLNSSLPGNLALTYRAVDFTRLSKTDPQSLLQALDVVTKTALESTSFFSTSSTSLCALQPSTPTETLAKCIQELAYMAPRIIRPQNGISGKVPLRWSVQQQAFVQMRLRTTFEDNLAQEDDEDSVPTTLQIPKMEFDALEDSDTLSVTGSVSSLHQQDHQLFFARSPSSASVGSLLQAKTRSPSRVVPGPGNRFAQHHKTFDGGARKVHKTSGAGLERDDEEEDDAYDSDDFERSIFARILRPLKQTFPAQWHQQFQSRAGPIRTKERIQRGVVRTNCIDCLDRTNLAQYLMGLHVLNEQLIAIGVLVSSEKLGTDSLVSAALMELYEELGDKLSHQYGGSDAHRSGGKLVSNAASRSRQQSLYTSVRRYYSNSFTDHIKQDAINVFLGFFEHATKETSVPAAVKDGEVSSDFYLHNREVTREPSFERDELKLFEGEWWRQPLETFALGILAPLRGLKTGIFVPVPAGSKDYHESVPKLVSFDAFLHNTFGQPRELTRPSTSSSLPKRPTPSPPKFRRLRSWNSNESTTSVSSQSGGVYHSIRSALFGKSMHGLPEDDESGISEAGSSRDSDIEYASSDGHRMELAFARLDPVERDYISQYKDPFGSMYSVPSLSTAPSELVDLEAWDSTEHEIDYQASIAEYNIDPDDGWGMRKLQAYSCTTNIVMYGPYKGYPRTFYAGLLELDQQGLLAKKSGEL